MEFYRIAIISERGLLQSHLKKLTVKGMTVHESEVKKYPHQMSLETANEMYKTAFLVKKTRFSVENPSLTDVELNQKTALYFKKLAEKK